MDLILNVASIGPRNRVKRQGWVLREMLLLFRTPIKGLAAAYLIKVLNLREIDREISEHRKVFRILGPFLVVLIQWTGSQFWVVKPRKIWH